MAGEKIGPGPEGSASGPQSVMAKVEKPGSTHASRVSQSGYRSRRPPANVLSAMPWRSGQTPVMIVAQPGALSMTATSGP